MYLTLWPERERERERESVGSCSIESLSPREEMCMGKVWGKQEREPKLGSFLYTQAGMVNQRVINHLLFGQDPIV